MQLETSLAQHNGNYSGNCCYQQWHIRCSHKHKDHIPGVNKPMSGSIYKAAAGALQQQVRLEMLSNNLANVNTIGYKADLPVFRFNEPVPEADPVTGDVPKLSPYLSPIDAATNFNEGALRKTGNPLDVAIVGKGFFAVQTPDGIQYTRKGRFSVNEQGQLSTTDGNAVMGQGGDIAIDGSRVEISEAGEVSVDGAVVDVLRIVDFERPYQMRKVGGTLFVPAESSVRPQASQNYRIAQGAVEASNVDALRTMTEMIESLRVFESYQKAIRAADDATAKTVSEVGRVA
jgi:flagellar basal-body rod protein FlgG